MFIGVERAPIAAPVAVRTFEYIKILKDHTEDHMSTALRANEPEDGRIYFLCHGYWVLPAPPSLSPGLSECLAQARRVTVKGKNMLFDLELGVDSHRKPKSPDISLFRNRNHAKAFHLLLKIIDSRIDLCLEIILPYILPFGHTFHSVLFAN